MNHVSFLEADIRVWKEKSNCEWIEPNFVFKIINFHLSYPLHLIVFIIHFCISCVPCVQIATPLLPICLKRTRRTCLWIRQTLIFRRAKLRQTRGQTYHELNMVRNCVALISWLQLKFVFVFLALKCLKIQTFRDYCPFIGERYRYTERASFYSNVATFEARAGRVRSNKIEVNRDLKIWRRRRKRERYKGNRFN